MFKVRTVTEFSSAFATLLPIYIDRVGNIHSHSKDNNNTPMFCSFRRLRIFLKELPLGSAPDNRPLRHNRSRSGANVVSRRQKQKRQSPGDALLFLQQFLRCGEMEVLKLLTYLQQVVSVLQVKT